MPCLARWPGKVPAGNTSSAIFATIDFAPTFAKLGGNGAKLSRLDASELARPDRGSDGYLSSDSRRRTAHTDPVRTQHAGFDPPPTPANNQHRESGRKP